MVFKTQSDGGLHVAIAPRIPAKPTPGHTYWFHAELQRGFLASQVALVVAGPSVCSADFVTPTLRFSSTDRVRFTYFPLAGIRQDLRSLWNLFNKYGQPGQTPTLYIYEGGVREFLLLVLLKRRNEAVSGYFNICLVDPWLTKSIFGSTYLTETKSFRELISWLSTTFVVSAETKELFEELQLGQFVPEREYPLFSSLERGRVGASLKFDILCAPLGDSEAEVCIEALEKLTQVLHNHYTVAFHMRWGSRLSRRLYERLEALGGVLIADKLSSAEYSTLYKSSRVVVLPYQTYGHYSFQTSGRLLDALISDCKVVVPRNTVLSRVAEETGVGRSFDPFSADSLYSALRELPSVDVDGAAKIFTVRDSATELTNVVKTLKSKNLIGQQSRPGLHAVGLMGIWLLVASPKSFFVGLFTLANLPLSRIAKSLIQMRRRFSRTK